MERFCTTMLQWGLAQTTDTYGKVLHHHATLGSGTDYGHMWTGSAPPCYAGVWHRLRTCVDRFCTTMLRWGLTQTTDMCGQVLHHHATLGSDTDNGHVWTGSVPPCYAGVWHRLRTCVHRFCTTMLRWGLAQTTDM